MSRKTDLETIKKIKFLRSQGYSLPEISKETSVPKTTIFRHIQNVEILPEFKDQWFGKRGGSKKRKLKREEEAYKEAIDLIKELSNKEKLLFLSAIYWGEGSKNEFGLSNTDPKLINVFINSLRDVFGVKNDRFRVSIRIYEDLDKNKCLDFWSKVVNIQKEKFVNVNVLKGKKKGKLEYGMCRIRILKGGDIFKKIMGVNRVITEMLTSDIIRRA
ncbi:MAG: hypothetical protein Q8P80_00575 [Candidatus Levybacteria bacterium]|nr:hypothetical protein [Candidatus Levybacteria bacterium]